MALSGGIAQRLMVARAILHNPAILFLDEPTAGLDPQSRIGLWEILGGLHESGQTVVLTTHNMEEADQLCDRIGIMDHGRILALDTPEQLKRSVGADTIVTVTSRRRPGRAGRAACASTVDGVDAATMLDGSVQLAVRGSRPGARARDRRRRGGRLRRPRRAGRAADARDGVHQPHREGAARLMAATDLRRRPLSAPARPSRSSRIAFGALLLRDLVVLRKRLREFVPAHDHPAAPALLRVPLRVPDDRHGRRRRAAAGVGESAFATILVAGVVGLSIMFQGIQAVALPMVQEFGYTREIEDRVLAPLPVSLVALEKVVFGALQGLLRGRDRVPDRGRRARERDPHPPAGALARADHADPARLHHLLGARAHLRHDLRPATRCRCMFGIIILPLTFLGGTYYAWTTLAPGQGRRRPLAAESRAGQPARSTSTRASGRRSPRPATCRCGPSTRSCSGSARCSCGWACATSGAA